MHHSHSLFYRVYKARYFPNCLFLEAEWGHKPSYVWWSLLSAREVILAGSRWMVGDGNQILVAASNWLDHKPMFIGAKDHSLRVGDLIDRDTWLWDRTKIYATFAPRTRNEILTIPLSRRRSRDKLIWKENSKHEFTVKSSYHVAIRLR